MIDRVDLPRVWWSKRVPLKLRAQTYEKALPKTSWGLHRSHPVAHRLGKASKFFGWLLDGEYLSFAIEYVHSSHHFLAM